MAERNFDRKPESSLKQRPAKVNIRFGALGALEETAEAARQLQLAEEKVWYAS